MRRISTTVQVTLVVMEENFDDIAIGIELKVRSNKGLTKKVTNHLYIYFPRRNLVDKIICVRGNNAIDLITGLLVASMVNLFIGIFLYCRYV